MFLLNPLSRRLGTFELVPGALFFSLRATFASILAFWLGVQLKLDSPAWAAITVWVVAQPSRGMTLSKGFYRLLGTCVGTLVAIFLILFLDNTPSIFLFVLAVWIGLTTAAANLVKYFRSYGAVLAGYTASIVGLLVFDHPDRVFEVATARVACILLGIIVVAVVNSFMAQSQAKQDLFFRIREVLADSIEWCSLILNQTSSIDMAELERRLVLKIGTIEELTSYAVTESLQIRLRRGRINELVASLFSMLSAARALEIHLVKNQGLATLHRAQLNDLSQLLKLLSVEWKNNGVVSQVRSTEIRAQFTALANQLEQSAQPAGVALQILGDRIEGLASAIAVATANSRDLMEPTKPRDATAFVIPRDTSHAKRVGFRSFIAVSIASAIWLSTHWVGGSMMVMMTAVNCGVFATSANPRSGLRTAMKASLLAIVAALGCHLIFHPELRSPYELAFILCLFLVPGGVVAASPKRAIAGTLFTVNFLVFLSPSLPMSPLNGWHLFTTASGFFASLVLTLLVFYFVLPTDGRDRMKRLARDIVRDLERVASARTVMRAQEWETLMYNRVSRLIQVSAETNHAKRDVIDGSFAALDVGRDVLKLQHLALSSDVRHSSRETIRECLTTLTALSQGPEDVERFSRVSAARITSPGDQVPISPVERRAAGALQEIADSISLHRRFFAEH